MGAIPARVTVYEVGPRDGLQNEDHRVPTDVKVELVGRLDAAGLPAVEATSFVHPKWVPQLADAEEVMERVGTAPGARHPVLVPNQGGLERAQRAGAKEVAVFGSVTEAFAQRNLNRSVDESLEMFAPVVEGARAAGLAVRGYLSMVWGDPWEGAVATDRVVEVCRRMAALGIDELSLGDTIGVATPADVRRVLPPVLGALSGTRIAVHFHDTYGQALANVLVALELGIDVVDSAVAGLGGCPFSASATGNLATEDLVYMLDGMGIETGVDLDAVVETAWWISEEFGREPVGRAARALRGRSAARPGSDP